MARLAILNPSTRSSVSLYLALRLLQVGASGIAGFTLCFLVWQHNNHYCAYYPDNCTTYQQSEIRVPAVYIALIASIVASVISAFSLSFTHISQIWKTITGVSESVVPYEAVDKEDDDFPIVKALKRALQSVTNTALLIDATILVFFLFAYFEYSNSIVLGRVFPVCYLFKYNSLRGDEYWKSVRVVDKECIMSQCAWVTCIFAMSFSLLIIILECFYLGNEWATKAAREGAAHEGQALLEVGKPPIVTTGSE